MFDPSQLPPSIAFSSKSVWKVYPDLSPRKALFFNRRKLRTLYPTRFSDKFYRGSGKKDHLSSSFRRSPCRSPLPSPPPSIPNLLRPAGYGLSCYKKRSLHQGTMMFSFSRTWYFLDNVLKLVNLLFSIIPCPQEKDVVLSFVLPCPRSLLQTYGEGLSRQGGVLYEER